MKKLIFSVLLLLMAAIGAVAQETLTVYDGTTTNSYVPFYGIYADYGTRCQFVIPADELSDMDGGSISQLTFYCSQSSISFDQEVTVYMKEVDYTTFASATLEDWSSMTSVYTGTIGASSNQMVISLNTPYTYEGGNLMIGLQVTTWGSSSPSTSWYGLNQSGYNTAAYNNANYIHNWNSSVSLQQFLPKTTFTYTPGTAPTCPKVNNLVADNITSSSADISWEAGGTEAAWVLKYGQVGFNVETGGTSRNISATPAFQITGLTANTQYDVYVKAMCGASDESDWRRGSLRTACGVESVPYTETFESFTESTVPTCWDNSASASSTLSTYPERIWGVYKYNDNSMLRMYNYYVNEGTALINSPSISIPSDGEYQLSFDYSHTASCGAFTVKISEDGGSSFTDLGSFAKVGTSTSYSDPGAFTEADPISLAAYAGKTVMLQFFANADYSQGAIFVDNISIDLAPSCMKPTELAYSNVASRTAVLSWTAGGTETAWQICLNDNEGSLIDVNTNSYTLTGLTPETAYDVKVRAKCGGSDGDSEWTNNISFTTAYEIPFLQEFGTVIPADWSQKSGLLANVMTGTALTSGSGWNFGTNNGVFDNHARTNIYGNSTNKWLLTPIITMDANVRLTFDLALTAFSGTLQSAQTSGTDDKFVVLISTDGGENWTILRQYDNAGSEYVYNDIPTAGEEVAINLSSYSSDNVIIAFYGESTTSNADNNLHIDNVRLDYIPNCVRPTGLVASNVYAREATLSWTAGASETAWQICLDNVESNPIDATNPYTLTGLDPTTTYNVKVRANCGGSDGDSEWTNNISFTTTVACPVPTAFTYSNISNTSATVSWTAGAIEGVWNLKYKKTADDEWTEVNGLTSSSYTITGLNGSTEYSVEVQADCESEGTSTWLSGSFTTAYEIPFLQEFGTVIPADWSQKSGLLANVMTGTALTSGNGWNFGTNNGVFDNHARTNIYGNSCKYWLLTPTIVMDANVRLTFDLALTTYSGNLQPAQTSGTDDKFIVLISTDGGENWTILRQYDNAGSEYVYNDIPTAGEEVAINLSSYSSDNVIIAFYGESTINNADNNLHIDNVRLDYIPNCVRPTGLAASNVYAREATLSWTAGGEETAWQICLDDNESNPIDVTNPYTLTGLDPETTYNVKVRANCGGTDGNSEWTNNISFTTTVSCPAPINIAVSGLTSTSATIVWEAGAFETEWNLRYKADGDGDWTIENDVTSPYTITGLTAETDYELQLQAVCALDDLSDWSSSVDVYTGYCQPATTRRDGKGITGVSFGSGDDVVNNSDEDGLPAASPYYGDYTNLVGAVQAGVETTVGITFETNWAYGTIVWIDLNNNLIFDGNEVVYVGKCEKSASPTTLAATFTLPVSTPTGDYRMRIAASDSYYSSYITSIAAAADANSCPEGSYYLIVNDYTVRVLAAPSCVIPTALTASSIGATTATLTWTAGNDETAWQVCVNGDEANLIDVDAPTCTVENLVANTDYTVKVRSNCGSDGVSDWSNNYEFTTAICELEDQCQITFVLTDGYGDGWESSVINVVDVATSDVLATWTVTGSSATGTLSVCNGRQIKFVWVNGGGRWDSEASYAVYDVNGIEIFSGSGAMDDDVTYTVDCTIKHTITASAGENGTIAPNGETLVADGENQPFAITPDECYHIASVLVDGEDAMSGVDGNGTYLFQNVTADHTIAATFAINTNEITATAGENGTITETSTVNCGDDKQITITPANCYSIASVLVDDVDVTATVVAANGVYTFENVIADHTIEATFEQITYTFTVNADANGSITANDGNGNVANCGENKSFTIAANDCYHVVSVLVDDVEVDLDENGVYTFENVTAAHTIAATFAINTYTITASAEGNGTINGESTANCGDNKSYIVAPANACYRIASFTVDGVDAIIDLDENGVYAMQNITSDHELVATFEQITYTITATAGENGTITETSTVNCGDNKEITITPANCYRIASVLVDDVDVTATVVAANGVYTFENVMSDHTIEAAFEQITYTFTVTADANGSITANDGNGNVVNCGENKSFTIEANDCYHVVSVTVDGVESINSLVNGVYTFENVTAPHTIAAIFAINTYYISASAEGNGTITESCTANCGENKSFVIQPQSICYRIASVLVDGVEAINDIDENGVYAFQNVTADHTIVATFEQKTYTITATAGENGTITENSTVNCGENKEITITPANCYSIASVLVDDVDVTATVVAANGVYTFENVMSNHTIAAAFEQITYTITATADANGSITANDGNGNVVNCGENKSFTIEANDCYHVESVMVDDVEVDLDENGVYTFENVTAPHTIAATFEQISYTVTATAGEGGSITETSTVNCGANKEITITANEGYRIASVIVDETENVTEAVIAAEGVYTFENVTADHTIAATFKRVHTISAGTGADGSITPEGIISVLDGESQTFTITPVNECFRIGQVMVDGVDVTDEVIANNGVYTFENVTENHNIVANFDAITLTITATAGAGGTIAHNADYEAIPCASNESYTIVANDGYRIVSVIVDDEFDVTNEVIANNGVYTFTNVRANHTIAATFGLIPANTYTITATAGENGTITPNGEVVVYEGDDQNFTIVAAEGYRVASVMVDETEVVAQLVNGVYTFTNITANHTIAATFEAIPTYTLTIHYVYADNTPAAEDHVETLVEGAEYSVASPVVTGYTADQLVIEGTMPANDVVVNVTYTINTYTITATAGENGTITPNGELVVNYGATQAFTIVANEGYRIASIMVDETEDVTAQLVDGVYTFENVIANHTIAATFESIPTYTLTIHYVYADNTPAADDYVETLVEGAEYSVASPVVTGHTADQLVVEGTMPAEDVVVNVIYTINTYTITATAGENGTITPSGDVVVNYGATQTFSISANDGYRIMSVLVDGAEAISELVDGVYTFANISANHTIAAAFVSEAATTYTITATADENGIITPSGVIEVVEGESRSFTIEAAAGYHIVSVMVDETENVTEQLVNGVYTFDNVTADHTIAASFAINTYTITATAGDNGTITPAEAIVNYGASQEFTILANEGYRIASVMVDETEDVTEEVVDGVYTFTNVTANHTIAATFEAIPVPTYTITLTVGEHGSVTPSGENGIVTVNEGDDITFTVTPDEGYLIGGLIVDETPVYCDVEGDVVNFYDVHANHTIEVVFTEIPATTYTITATAGANGTINPEGEVTVTEGENKEFTIVANEGYRIASVIVDADTEDEEDVTDSLENGVYTFENVTANHTIYATFEDATVPNTHTVTLTVGDHGTVTASDEDDNEIAIVDGAITVNHGDDLYLEITPDENYKIETLAVNGVEYELDEEEELGLTLPMLEITEDMAVSVTFTSVIAAEMFEAGSMTVYPNPNNGMFSIDFSNIEGDATYQIINANGAVVETRDINVMNGETMNFSHDLRPGAYFVRIINGEKVYVEQIVVE